MTYSAAISRDYRPISSDLRHPHRALALASLALLSVIIVRELYQTAVIVGVGRRILAIAAVAIILGIYASRWVPIRLAAVLGGGGITIGLLAYLWAAPGGLRNLINIGGLIRDALSLASGYPILSILALDTWLTVITPIPLVLIWYFGFREHYVSAAAIGALLLVFLIGTADIGSFLAVLGVIGAIGAIGFGDLHRRGAPVGDIDILALMIALMLILSLSISAIPSGSTQPITPAGGVGSGEVSTAEAILGSEEMTISGTPTLDPTVRFTIEADEPENWRVDSFDRYTGDGWVQSGDARAFEGSYAGQGAELTSYGITAEYDGVSAFPAAWQPISVSGTDDEIVESPGGGLSTAEGFDAEDEIEVISQRVNDSAIDVDLAVEPPESISDRYTQLPETTPDEVGDYTEELIEDAETYEDAAEIITQYIIATNDYSLDVDAPESDIAYEQLFELDEGYCVYFATTMAVMLRTQDIPARVATGYSAGERVDEDRWVVRGMNAHAWVEVYVPDVGWVDFDPTPSAPYEDARADRLEEAREEGEENVDTDETGEEEWQPDDADDFDGQENATDITGDGPAICDNPYAIATGELSEEEASEVCSPDQLAAMEETELPGGDQEITGADEEQALDELDDMPVGGNGDVEDEEDGDADDDAIPLPSSESIAFALALLIAGVAGVHRGRLADGVHHRFATQYQRRSEPTGAVERSWRRLERHLANKYSERNPGESVRAYVRRLDRTHSVDRRIHDVAARYEQARYSSAPITGSEAETTVTLVDELVGRRIPRVRSAIRE